MLRIGRFIVCVLLVVTSSILAQGTPAARAERRAGAGHLPASVEAFYRVSFGPLENIGSLQFRSDVNGDDYTLFANAKVEAVVLEYVGQMQSSGSLLSAETKPASYMYHYRQKPLIGKKKDATLRMGFDESGVTEIAPRSDFWKRDVPITAQDLKDVLDPLSAVMALSLGEVAAPCDRKLPIFDGKLRFDLVFQPTGRPVGPKGAVVCRVTLIPIAGHNNGQGSDKVISGEIEVTLQPVPEANLVIPILVRVPTIVGTAVLKSQKVQITMPDHHRFAL